MPGDEIIERMAYDLLQSPDFQKKLEEEEEMLKAQQMTDEERFAAIRAMFGGAAHG